MHYGYVQICHYAQSITPNLQFSAPSPFERIILEGKAWRGMISDIYKLLLHPTPRQTFLHWERVLLAELSLEDWQMIWSQAAKSSLCTLYRENMYKILYFWYMTPDVLHSIYPTCSDHCWRCLGDKGTQLHIFWSCPLIAPFWHSVHLL